MPNKGGLNVTAFALLKRRFILYFVHLYMICHGSRHVMTFHSSHFGRRGAMFPVNGLSNVLILRRLRWGLCCQSAVTASVFGLSLLLLETVGYTTACCSLMAFSFSTWSIYGRLPSADVQSPALWIISAHTPRRANVSVDVRLKLWPFTSFATSSNSSQFANSRKNFRTLCP